MREKHLVIIFPLGVNKTFLPLILLTSGKIRFFYFILIKRITFFVIIL